jgi:hypothetical protein
MNLFSGIWTLMVGTIAFFSGACFTALAPSGYMDRSTAWFYTTIGLVGTTLVAMTFRSFCRRPPSWNFLAVRRNIVLLVVSLAWVFGVVGGLTIFYVIPRTS